MIEWRYDCHSPGNFPEEIQEILKDLHAKGVFIPKPQSVRVVASEDHQGDPALFMTVTFGRRHKPEEIPWMTVSPLIRELSRRVFTKGGETIPVISEVRRLSEKLSPA